MVIFGSPTYTVTHKKNGYAWNFYKFTIRIELVNNDGPIIGSIGWSVLYGLWLCDFMNWFYIGWNYYGNTIMSNCRTFFLGYMGFMAYRELNCFRTLAYGLLQLTVRIILRLSIELVIIPKWTEVGIILRR